MLFLVDDAKLGRIIPALNRVNRKYRYIFMQKNFDTLVFDEY